MSEDKPLFPAIAAEQDSYFATIQCPHCDEQITLGQNPNANFMKVWVHMVENHFEIAYRALLNFQSAQNRESGCSDY